MNKETKTKKPKLAMVLKLGGLVVGLFGIATLINNIMIFNTTVSQAIEQGYPKEMVMEAIVPTQLLPGIFEAIGMYGGLALLMFVAGIIACKYLPREEIIVEVVEEEIVEPVVVDSEF